MLLIRAPPDILRHGVLRSAAILVRPNGLGPCPDESAQGKYLAIQPPWHDSRRPLPLHPKQPLPRALRGWTTKHGRSRHRGDPGKLTGRDGGWSTTATENASSTRLHRASDPMPILPRIGPIPDAKSALATIRGRIEPLLFHRELQPSTRGADGAADDQRNNWRIAPADAASPRHRRTANAGRDRHLY